MPALAHLRIIVDDSAEFILHVLVRGRVSLLILLVLTISGPNCASNMLGWFVWHMVYYLIQEF